MIRLFIDFDGTITRADVGDVMFERFGGAASAEAVRQYREGILSAAECFRRECAACGTVDVAELDAFLDAQPIDETFIAFTRFCREEAMELTVVSDGMDYYIRRILARHGLGDVRFLSNALRLVTADAPGRATLQPAFPYLDEVCDRCASCKRNHMLSLSADEDIIIYVGEGYSDRCPVRFADVVFAKDDLLRHCQEENISYYAYRQFSDVEERLRQLLAGGDRKGGLRKRRQAELARREVFLGG